MGITSSQADTAPVHGCWESLDIGYSFDTSGRTITESDVVGFACMTGDFNSLHVNAEYAKSSIFGERIAHGLLVLSVLAGLTTQSSGYRSIVPYLVALMDLHCAFRKPAFIGDTIFGRITVVEKRESKRRNHGEVIFRRDAINQRGEVVLEANFRMLVKREKQS